MKILFALFLCIDVIVLLILGYEAFMVSSNKNHVYLRWFILLLGLIAAALLLRSSRFNLAFWLAGAPAIGILLFVSIMLISMLTHKGPWN